MEWEDEYVNYEPQVCKGLKTGALAQNEYYY